MPVTPAREARDRERRTAQMEEGRRANEVKFTEFRMNCDAGYVGACTSLGEWFELMRNDFASAVELYRPACFEKGYPQACFNLGNALVRGHPGVPASPAEATRAYARACEGGNADACGQVGRLLLREVLAALPGRDAVLQPPPLQQHGRMVQQASSTSQVDPPLSESTSAVPPSPGSNSPPSDPHCQLALVTGAASQPPVDPLSPHTERSSASARGRGFRELLPPEARAALERSVGYLARGCTVGTSASHGNCCHLLATLRMDHRLERSVNGVDVPDTLPSASGSSTDKRPEWAKQAERDAGEGDGGGGGGAGEAGSRGGSVTPRNVLTMPVPALLARACSAENVKACAALGALHRGGSARFGVSPDKEAAYRYARQGLLWGGVGERAADRQARAFVEQHPQQQ